MDNDNNQASSSSTPPPSPDHTDSPTDPLDDDDDWDIPERSPTPPDLFTMDKDQPLKHVHRM
jgi:hypothetical protein